MARSKKIVASPKSILDSHWLFIGGGVSLFLAIIWGAVVGQALFLSPYLQGMGYILFLLGFIKILDQWVQNKKVDRAGLNALVCVLVAYAVFFSIIFGIIFLVRS